MFHYAAYYLIPYWSVFNVVQYISVRAVCALFTAFFVSFLYGNRFIRFSRRFFASAPREFAPESHQSKQDMPILGGVFILINVLVAMIFWGRLDNPQLFICLLAYVLFSGIGFCDDVAKIYHKKGIAAWRKFLLQLGSALLVLFVWELLIGPQHVITIPFFKQLYPNIGIFFFVWVPFLLIGSSNAVNLTDGLDGLAIGSLLTNFGVFSIVAYLAGHCHLAAYLAIPCAASAEITVLGAALVGASLGFLWYNAYPAQIFMGDAGSLGLGAVLAMMALITKQELLLAISGGLFVIETLSVIIQVLSFRLWKKRVFRMAPLHHHFELQGWQEAKVTARFAIVSFLLALLALITLKLR